MIRFLQTNSRISKAIFVVIIGVVSVGIVVVYLIPGLTGQGPRPAMRMRRFTRTGTAGFSPPARR